MMVLASRLQVCAWNDFRFRRRRRYRRFFPAIGSWSSGRILPLAPEDRLGPSYFARVYGLGPSGLDYADAWLRENRAEHYEAQELRHWLFALDQLLCDGVDIVNSVGCEGIARRCLAIEWTYKMGGPCSPGALEFFAAKLCSTSSDVRVPAADRAVRRQLAFNASFAKLARRAARVSDASTAWW